MLHFRHLQDGKKVFEALSSDVRIKILEMIMDNSELNLDFFAKQLGISNSAVTMHIHKLHEAGLIEVKTASGKRGSKKICALTCEKIMVELSKEGPPTALYTTELDIGQFSDYDIMPTCGIVTANGIIGEFDEPRYFSFPERYNAAALWFACGYLKYRLPNSLRANEQLKELQISFEIASEAPGFSAHYPSDIHFSINGIDLGFWTTPGEYNDRRGIFTPDWWFLNLGQYGKMKMLSVNSQGTFIDGFRISEVTVDQLNISANSEISFVISAPKDAANCGGLTLFGKNFGDYNQGILVNMLYETPAAQENLSDTSYPNETRFAKPVNAPSFTITK